MSMLESDKKEQCGRLEGNAAITHEVAGKSHQKPLPDDALDTQSDHEKRDRSYPGAAGVAWAGKDLIAPA
ncbi:hypothetical protein ACRARH_09790 [Phytobacter ursingii]